MTHESVAQFFRSLLWRYKQIEKANECARNAIKKLAQMIVREPLNKVEIWFDGARSSTTIHSSDLEVREVEELRQLISKESLIPIGFQTIDELVRNKSLFATLVSQPFILNPELPNESIDPSRKQFLQEKIFLDPFTVKYGNFVSKLKPYSSSMSQFAAGITYSFRLNSDGRQVLEKIGRYRIVDPRTTKFQEFDKKKIRTIFPQGSCSGACKAMQRVLINQQWIFYRYKQTSEAHLLTVLESIEHVNFWNRLYAGTGYDCAFELEGGVYLPETPDDSIPKPREFSKESVTIPLNWRFIHNITDHKQIANLYPLYNEIYFAAFIWMEQKFSLAHTDFLSNMNKSMVEIVNADNVRIHLDHENEEISFHPIDIDSFKLLQTLYYTKSGHKIIT